MTATPLPDSATHVRLVALALFVGTLLIFSRSLFGEFLNYDDQDYVTRNTHVQSGLTADTVRWAFTATVASNWHPLTWLSHELDWTLYGDKPVGHHATSVLIHAFSAALAFLALRRLTGAFWTAAFCAALWAWHPLRVESVAWVAERKDVLGAFFWFLTLWTWAGYAQNRAHHAPHARRWYTGALGAFALGLLSKPMLVTLPCVLLLLDFWPLKRTRWSVPETQRPQAPTKNKNIQPTPSTAPKPPSIASLLLEKLPFFLLSAISCYVTYLAQKIGGSVSADLTFGPRLANAFISIPRYLAKFLWPTDLAALYPHPGSWGAGPILLAVLFVLGLTALVLLQWRRRPWASVGWFWFIGTLVPVSGIVQVGLQSMADRYTYLPIIGVQIAALWTLREFATSASLRRTFSFVASSVLLACAITTWTTQAVWKNSFTLFTQAVHVTRENYLAWNNLGTWYSDQERYAESIPCYREALDIKDDYVLAHNNLGHALAETGALPAALRHYQIALQLKPDLLTAHRNYASALADSGRPDEALGHYRFVLDRDPGNEDAMNGCGMALALKGQFPDAEKILLAARALPNAKKKIDTQTNLATVYAMSGRLAEAADEYRAILKSSPNEAKVHNNFANVLFNQNAPAEAVGHYRQAIKLQPYNPQAHSNLGLSLLKLGQYDEGRKELRLALEQQPDLPQIRAVLKELDTAHPPEPSAP